MKPDFSFKYNNEILNADSSCKTKTPAGALYTLGNGIEVTLKVNEYKEYDAVEWVLWFENKSSEKSGMFSDISDCDTLLPISMPPAKCPGYMPKEGDACVITMNGMVDGSNYWENDKVSASEYGFTKEFLSKAPDKHKKFANVEGRSSDGMMPFFDVTAFGCGYIAAIGWTGDWKAEFTEKEDGIHIKTGLKETNFYLKPGEKIRTSSVLVMKYDCEDEKHNKFRRLIRNHFSHKSCTGASRDGIMANELWGGLTSEEMKKRLTEYKNHDISFEDIWIDAGWYGNCTKCDEAFSGDWASHTGEWEVNKRVHPCELADVSECAKEIGANLMLWLEPERAIDGTKITKEHPEWFLNNPECPEQKILYYGNEDAKNYVYELLCYYIEKLELSCYRQDFNIGLTEFFRLADESDRRGITEIKHITGMYDLWDAIHQKHPGILIDNCSSGGRRIDIETLKRSVPFFRSDYQCNFNENPEVLQTHNAGISCYLPYNGCTSKTKNDTYAIRSSYSSSWGGAFYNAVFQSMTEEDFEWVRKITNEYRHIRKYMHMDFYNHASSVFDDTSWAIWQYHNPETQSGIVMAFRRSNSPFETVTVNLKGLESGKKYSVINLDTGKTQEISDTLEIVLKEKRSCMIFEYFGE